MNKAIGGIPLLSHSGMKTTLLTTYLKSCIYGKILRKIRQYSKYWKSTETLITGRSYGVILNTLPMSQ